MYIIETINTGVNSYTTVNNYGIIDTINAGKNSSLTVNNHNKDKDPISGKYIIGIKNITGQINSRINVNNYGGIGEIHTGEYSENEIHTWGNIAWLETGLNNDTKVSGAGHISRSDGKGKTQYKFFKGKDTVWVDSDNKTMREYLERQGWSSNPPESDYGCGFITIKVKQMPIYVPGYINGTNSNYNYDGWKTLDEESLKLLCKDTDWFKFIGDIGSINGDELAAIEVPLNDVIYVNGSKSGKVDFVGIFQNPILAAIMLGLEAANSYRANTTNYHLTVTVQQKGDKFRTVLQLESDKNPMQTYPGKSYYYLDTSDLMEPGRVFYVQALRDNLKDMGYGDYIKGDKKTNLYITMDELHKDDASMGYISLENGDLMFTPKLYKKDEMKIVNNKQFLGICIGHEVRLDVRKDLEKTVKLNDYGISIVEEAAEGEVIFNK